MLRKAWHPAMRGSSFKVTPTLFNASVLGIGLGLGILSFNYRNTALGQTLLGAGGSMAAVGLVLFLKDLLVARSNTPLLQA